MSHAEELTALLRDKGLEQAITASKKEQHANFEKAKPAAPASKQLNDKNDTPLEFAVPAIPYSHEAMIDLMVANPGASHAKLALHFGKTKGWLASIIASDSFQRALDPRRHEVLDPTITATMEERFRALTLRSLSVLHDKMDSPECSDLVVLKAAEIGVKALGAGQPLQAPTAPAPTTVESLAEKLVNALEKQRSNVKRREPEVQVVEVASGNRTDS